MSKSGTSAKVADINSPESAAATGPSAASSANPSMAAPRTGAEQDSETLTETARKAAADKAREAKEATAETAKEQADKVREAGESFDAGSYARAATDQIADHLGDAAQSIRGTDLAALSDDVATFARRQPLLFFGGAALLGFAAGRMLKASERADETTHDVYRHDVERFG